MLYLVILCLGLVSEALAQHQNSTVFFYNTTSNYTKTTTPYHVEKTPARLVGGPSNATGLLQLYYRGEWVNIYVPYSSVMPSQNDLKVICNMLGYAHSDLAYAFNTRYGNTLFGKQQGPIGYPQLHCRGDEHDVSQCSGWSSFSISRSDSSSYDLALTCDNSFIRIQDGDTAHSGRLEMFSMGDWHSICDTYFDDHAAKVVCGMLGFKNTGIAKAYRASLYGPGRGTTLISSLSCRGYETNIMDCSPSFGTCDHKQEIGVNCDSTPIRLVNGPTNNSGRVEVLHGGTWGTICGYPNFDEKSVQVMCRMLGINNSHAFGYANAFYGEGDSFVMVQNMRCDGSESDIALCSSSEWASAGHTTSSCEHSYDVGLNCDAKTPIRLVDGGTELSGRLEILRNGYWGTVSSTGFDKHDLQVVCRMLGVVTASKSFFMINGYYGQGTGEVLVKSLDCDGGEVDIGLCRGTWWPSTVSAVDHSQDVGVNCDGVIPIRINGDNNSSGLVEVFHNGEYGTVCSTNFDRLDLIVVCRMLGFDNMPKSAYWYVGSNTFGIGEIVVSSLACNGIEGSIGQCSGTWPATTSCTHDNDVYVNCAGVPETLRLVDGKTNYSGRVEIYHIGEWGTICDISFDRPDAVVICRILGFPHPERAVAHTNAHFGAAKSNVPTVMNELHCNGLETTLGQCNPTWITSGYCSHNRDIGVDCCPNCQAAIIG